MPAALKAGPVSTAAAPAIRNYYDLKADKSVDATDIPQSLVLNYVYELPVGKGKKFGGNMNTIEDEIAGGWQVSGITHVQAGFPLSIGNARTKTRHLFGAEINMQPYRIRFKGPAMRNAGKSPTYQWDQSLASSTRRPLSRHPDYRMRKHLAQIAAAFGNVPRYLSNLRAPGYIDEDLGIQKWFNVPEKFRLQFTAQLFNAFNHANFLSPDTGHRGSRDGREFGHHGSETDSVGRSSWFGSIFLCTEPYLHSAWRLRSQLQM